MIALPLLRSFVQTVESGSFSQAARLLGISPAAVSKHIAQLEDELAVRLFHRNTRALSPTPAGQQYYREVSHGLSQLAQAEAGMQRFQAQPAGLLRLNMPLGFAHHVALPWLHDFARQHPGVQLDITFENRTVDLVAEGYDLAMGNTLDEERRLVARAFYPMQRIVVASPGYLARAGTPERLDELAQHACIVMRAADSGRLLGWPLREGGVDRYLTPNGVLIVNDPLAAVDAAEQGWGLAMVASFQVARQLESGALQAILTEHVSAPRPMYLYYPDRQHLSPAVQALVRFLVERAEQAPPPLFAVAEASAPAEADLLLDQLLQQRWQDG